MRLHKPPFAGPQQVLDYVGRYTHRVAISNNRLLDIEDDRVRFLWKGYRDNNRQKTMTLSADEFIRRFLIYILPERAGFGVIYGHHELSTKAGTGAERAASRILHVWLRPQAAL